MKKISLIFAVLAMSMCMSNDAESADSCTHERLKRIAANAAKTKKQNRGAKQLLHTFFAYECLCALHSLICHIFSSDS